MPEFCPNYREQFKAGHSRHVEIGQQECQASPCVSPPGRRSRLLRRCTRWPMAVEDLGEQDPGCRLILNDQHAFGFHWFRCMRSTPIRTDFAGSSPPSLSLTCDVWLYKIAHSAAYCLLPGRLLRRGLSVREDSGPAYRPWASGKAVVQDHIEQRLVHSECARCIPTNPSLRKRFMKKLTLEPRRADHLRKGLLGDLGDQHLGLAGLAELGHQQQDSRQRASHWS